jgi:hypothetical protein
MPNHGFRVEKNGAMIVEQVVNDVSSRGIDLLSPEGAVAIGL